MNDDLTTDSGDAADEPLDERVLAVLRDVPMTSAEVRRAHLDTALDEYDRLQAPAGDAPIAPVVPLRRRSPRVLQVAAAIVLVVGGLAVAVRIGNGASDQSADTSATGSSATSSDRDGDSAGAGSEPAFESAPDSPAEGNAALHEPGQDATARSAADDAAKQFSGTTIAPASGVAQFPAVGSPRVPTGPVPGSLGAYATDADLRADVVACVAAGTLPAGIDPEVGCAAPAEVGLPGTGTSADVAGRRRIVWVQRNADGSAGTTVVVDAATCRPVA